MLYRLSKATPSFLEKAVVALLIAMGHGGGDASMGRVTGRTGDGGIDGTIKDFAAQNPKRVVLINGRRLARLIVRYDVGVRDPHRPPILIKAIDEDFFDYG